MFKFKKRKIQVTLPPSSWKWSLLSNAKLKKILFHINILFLQKRYKPESFSKIILNNNNNKTISKHKDNIKVTYVTFHLLQD